MVHRGGGIWRLTAGCLRVSTPVFGNGLHLPPLNRVPGAVVTLMERSNVDTVIVAGKVRKWRGALLDVDLPNLRRELEASRDYLFEAAGVPRDLFRA